MKKTINRRRPSVQYNEGEFSPLKKYIRIQNEIYSLDKKSLDLINKISSKLRKSISPKKSTSRRNELERYFEQRG